MLSIMPLKRPSSARRNIRQETFSSSVSCARLRNIQSLLKGGSAASDSNLDALLCILGIDSRYNDGTNELVNYLLFGFFDLRKDEIERSGFAEETVDDLILVIKRDSVHVYCNPINYMYFLPYIAHWRNLRIHCMTETEYEDEEAAEEFKIYSFIEMVKDCPNIGIPYTVRGHPQKFDKFVIEKWPIVQAYALEGFGGGGFFTLKHELFDASAECHCVYSMVDPVNLEQLVTEQLPLFERQWKSMVANVDVKQASGLSTLSESSICEPLKSYYNHGLMSRMEEELNIKRPFVLFGTKSERSRLTRARSRGITDSDDPIVGTAGINGKHPTHMVCQSVSPRGPICCARTYFFSSGHIPYPVAGGAGDLSRDKTDLSIMNKLYVEGIHAVLTAIQVYCKTHSIQKAETVMFDTLKRECERNKLPLGSLFASSRDYIEFRIGAVDMEGQEVSLTEGQRSPFLKIAQLSLFNIPSIEHKNETMGSVLFTETFMDSNLQVLNQDGTSSVDHQCLVLTEHLPRYISWAATENDIKMSKEVGSFIKMSGETHYGRVLINGESAHVFTSNQLAIPEEGKFYVYEKGIVFQHNRFGPIVLPKTHMEKLNFYDGDSPSVVALIIVTYKASFWQWLPLQNQSKDNILVFALTPRTKAYKAFFSEVLSVWQKTEDEPAMVMAEKLPEKYIHVHNELQNAYNMEHGSPSRHITPMVKAEAIIPKLKEFVSHHSVTSVGNSCVPHDDLSAVLNQPYDPGNFQDEIIITILSGIPGSHKENLCTTLTNLAKEQNRWITLKPALDFVDGFNTQSLQNSLTSIVTASRKRSGRASASSRKKQRVLIMTPSFTDVFDVVQAIACHPDPEIGRSLKIGAVSTCVDPLNSFMTHRYTFPKLLDQCAEGWVNNIICTSSTAIKNPDLDVLQQLLRSVNHDVALLLANNGEVTRSPDVDLILSESAFTESKMIRQRYLSCPGWSLGKFSSGTMTPPMTEICLKFAPPLEKNRLMNKLRTLRGALSKYPFQGNIYTVRGRVRFSDSGLKATEFNCVTLSGYLLMTPAEVHPVPPPSSAANGPVSPQDQSNLNFVVFVGVELQENKLKEWLRACVKPKPQKKQLRTRQSLTKQELKNIHTKHHLSALPEGWFYNGSQYVSMAGDKTSSHPNMDKFIDEYVDLANKDIENYNTRIDQHKFVDLFDD